MKPLTPQQECFAREVAKGKSQSEAYRVAYPKSRKWKAESLRVNAAKMLADANVSLRIQELMQQAAQLAVLEAADVIRGIKAIAFSDIGGIMYDDGRVKLPNELDDKTRAAVKSFKIDEYGRIEYQFWDKNAALDKACKILGMFERDNKQKTDPLTALLDSLSGRVLGVVPQLHDPEYDPETE